MILLITQPPVRQVAKFSIKLLTNITPGCIIQKLSVKTGRPSHKTFKYCKKTVDKEGICGIMNKLSERDGKIHKEV